MRGSASIAFVIGLASASGCAPAPPAQPAAAPTAKATPVATPSTAAVEAPVSSPADSATTETVPVTESREPAHTTASTAKFVNVAEAAGLKQVIFCGSPEKRHILESVGSGCAWIDYDEDGKLDIFVVNSWALDDEPRQIREKGRNVLYRNVGGGKFEDVTAAAGVAGDDWGCGVCAGDFDNDGHVDLYVTNFGPNRLYRNRGNGTFEEMSEKAGVMTPGWSAGAAFFDADGDGWLDLYVAKYIESTWDEVLVGERTNLWRDTAKVMVGPFGMRGGKDQFFHNNKDGTFSNTTDAVGMTDLAESYGLGVIASDLDSDGDVDVYVGNDSNPNFLYRNDGKGEFTEVGGWSGAAVSAEGRPQASMGVDAGDFDGDGLPEIFTTNFAQDFATLYHNQGELFFEDISGPMKMKAFTYPYVKWGCAFVDYDLDTLDDLVILNGHIYPQVDEHKKLNETYKQLPTLLHHVGKEFVDVSREAGPGFQQAESMRGLAVADYDDDGKPDLLITAIDSPPLLLHNETPTTGNWVKVRLLNRHGSPAIGAVARLTTGARTQWRDVRSGATYCSQSGFDLLYGLGNAAQVDKLEIRWPGGLTTTEQGLPINQLHTFREPERPGESGP